MTFPSFRFSWSLLLQNLVALFYGGAIWFFVSDMWRVWTSPGRPVSVQVYQNELGHALSISSFFLLYLVLGLVLLFIPLKRRRLWVLLHLAPLLLLIGSIFVVVWFMPELLNF